MTSINFTIRRVLICTYVSDHVTYRALRGLKQQPNLFAWQFSTKEIYYLLKENSLVYIVVFRRLLNFVSGGIYWNHL